MSNAHAAAMGRLRWKGIPDDERKALLRPIASSGGKAAWAKLSPEERSREMTRRAAKRRKRPPR